MRTLWHGRWIETPSPHPVPGSVLLRVEATVPVLPLGAVHGREFGNPVRKVLSFAVTDGPAATARKVRAKRAESGYSGDYHLIVALGRRVARANGDDPRGPLLLALVPRAPRCASALLVPEGLVREVGDVGDPELAAAATVLGARADLLGPLVRQSYLYSAMAPPAELEAALNAAVAAAARPIRSPHAEVLRPLRDEPEATATLLELEAATPGPSLTSPPLAILGAGDYVRIEVAPALGQAGLERAVIADREPQIAALAAAELGFAAATTDAAAAVEALDRRGFVVVATAHDSHSELAALALEAGHRVLCEKPAAVTPADLARIMGAAEANHGELEVGFNRRHNPLVERARREVAAEAGPMTIVASIREVDINPDHWYLWPNQGTRVAGNLCHWIDLALLLLGPGPEPVSATVSPRVSAEPTGIDAERAFSIAFDDGSVVNLVPTGRGDSVRGVQEQIEVRRGDLTTRLDDLWRLSLLRSGRSVRRRTLWRDKGHGRMYAAALGRFERGEPAAYPLGDLRRGAEIQLALTELLVSGAAEGEISRLLDAARRR